MIRGGGTHAAVVLGTLVVRVDTRKTRQRFPVARPITHRLDLAIRAAHHDTAVRERQHMAVADDSGPQ